MREQWEEAQDRIRQAGWMYREELDLSGLGLTRLPTSLEAAKDFGRRLFSEALPTYKVSW